MKGSRIGTLAFVLVLAGGRVDAAELCVDPDDIACFDSIQEAVDAASSGDTIVVRPLADGAAYGESVVVTTSGLTLTGEGPAPFRVDTFEELASVDWAAEANVCRSKAKVDNCETAALGDSCGWANFTLGEEDRATFVIGAADVTIRNLTIRHGHTGVWLREEADGVRLVHNCFIHDDRWVHSADAVAVVDGAVLRFNRILGSRIPGILVGDNARQEWNLASNSEGLADLAGNDHVVRFNAVDLTTDHACIDVDGDRALISGNYLTRCENGVTIEGNDGVVADNVIENGNENGIQVVGGDVSTGWTISGNEIRAISKNGVLGRQLDASFILNNRIEEVGTATPSLAGISLIEDSDLNLVESNWVRGGGKSGIRIGRGVQGDETFMDENVVRGNLVELNLTSGVAVDSGAGNEVDGNTVLGNLGEGLDNGLDAVGTDVTDNTFLEHFLDICNDGGVGVFSGNTFVSGGTTEACVVAPDTAD